MLILTLTLTIRSFHTHTIRKTLGIGKCFISFLSYQRIVYPVQNDIRYFLKFMMTLLDNMRPSGNNNRLISISGFCMPSASTSDTNVKIVDVFSRLIETIYERINLRILFKLK